MKAHFPGSAPILVQIGQETLAASQAGRSMEAPLERAADGRLAPACKARLIEEFKRFSGTSLVGARALCAIDGRGVSLRRLTVPAANSEEQERLLSLQIEAEFPLPPEQLAWGWLKVSSGGGTKGDQVLIAAVKAEVVSDYAELFAGFGARARFTPAALIRTGSSSLNSGLAAALHLEEHHCELLVLENGLPSSLRCFSWGTAELKATLDGTGGTEQELVPERLAALILAATGKEANGKKLSISGALNGEQSTLTALVRMAGMTPGFAAGSVAEELGAMVERRTPILWLNAGNRADSAQRNWTDVFRRKSALVAAALLACALVFPYSEAIVCKPFLARKLAAIKEDRGRLAAIDRELAFLRYLKDNQPPYLDAFYLLARSAPPGTKIDSLTINRRGELSFRGSVRDANQVADLRSKLLDYDAFANLAAEEQTPSPDRRTLTLRLSAQWLPAKVRTAAAQAAGSAASASNVAKPANTSNRPEIPAVTRGPTANNSEKPVRAGGNP
jgi:hypothetical protein